MNIYFIRHGESQFNKEGKLQGQMDPPLSDKGEETASSLARDMKETFVSSGREINAIYSSPLKRAKETADAISGATGAPVRMAPNLQEIRLGDWEGRKISNIAKTPQFIQWRKNPQSITPPGGEEIKNFQDRAVTGIKKIIEDNSQNDNIIVVTHGGVIGALISYALKEDISNSMKRVPDNLSITSMEIDGAGEWKIASDLK
ncbi:MAG: histidine phosphatase family protein [Candidatus Eremiobacteraeota bacterium]|nr:histidine phosphatase family protein [Candidatus Eremiobacteraeota bacterium]